MQHVRKVFGCKQASEEDKWADKVVNHLIKKLRRQPGALQELERALSCPGTQSKCITLPRNAKGTIKVFGIRTYPHVIACRVYRWPDLQSRLELESMEHCEHPFSLHSNANDVCINPYHFRRVQNSAVLPVILVPRGFLSVPTTSETVESITIHHRPCKHQVPISHGGLKASSSNVLDDDDTPITFEEPDYWCNIIYFELNRRVGHEQYFHKKLVTVDSLGPSRLNDRVADILRDSLDRFSIYNFSHTDRNSSIVSTRRRIGKGFVLTYIEGDVYAECLSNSAVFIQSHNYNHINGHPPTTVFKLTRGRSVKIFSNLVFGNLLEENIYQGFEALYEMTKMCTIRVSFVKGWGENYQIQEITSTPCWVEVHLRGALKWLDKILVLGRPQCPISSDS